MHFSRVPLGWGAALALRSYALSAITRGGRVGEGEGEGLPLGGVMVVVAMMTNNAPPLPLLSFISFTPDATFNGSNLSPRSELLCCQQNDILIPIGATGLGASPQ